MEPLGESLRLSRRPGGIRVAEESEIYALREQLKHHAAAVRAIPDAASRLRRPWRRSHRGTSKPASEQTRNNAPRRRTANA